MASPYPPARRSDASTTYKSKAHGEVVVPEPYDWLETPPSQSAETKAWTEAQAAYTAAYVQNCADKPALQQRLQQNWDYARTSAPSLKADGYYYYSYNPGLLPQSVIYRATRAQVDAAQRAPMPAGPMGEPFFDTNALSDDGTVALTVTSFSHTGRYLAYGVSRSGSDWFKIFVRETSAPMTTCAPGTEGGDGRLDDVLDHIKFSGITWTHDDRGFFYQRFPQTSHQDKGTETDANQDAQLYYHRLGTPQSDDVLIIDSDAHTPSSMWDCEVSDDGQWLFLDNSKDTDTKHRYFVASLAHGVEHLQWIPLSTEFKYALEYLANDGTRFYLRTNKDAPNYRVVAVDIDPAQAQRVDHVAQLEGGLREMHDVIAEDKEAILTTAAPIHGDKLLVVYSRDVKDELWVHDLHRGTRITRLLPDLVGTIGQITGRREHDASFVLSVSFANPGRVDRVSWPTSDATPTVELFSTTQVAGIRAEDYVSTQVFFESKDGTKVPMFLTHRKDTKLDGTAPALVYFYGGFNIPLARTWPNSPSDVLAVDDDVGRRVPWRAGHRQRAWRRRVRRQVA